MPSTKTPQSPLLERKDATEQELITMMRPDRLDQAKVLPLRCRWCNHKKFTTIVKARTHLNYKAVVNKCHLCEELPVGWRCISLFTKTPGYYQHFLDVHKIAAPGAKVLDLIAAPWACHRVYRDPTQPRGLICLGPFCPITLCQTSATGPVKPYLGPPNRSPCCPWGRQKHRRGGPR